MKICVICPGYPDDVIESADFQFIKTRVEHLVKSNQSISVHVYVVEKLNPLLKDFSSENLCVFRSVQHPKIHKLYTGLYDICIIHFANDDVIKYCYDNRVINSLPTLLYVYGNEVLWNKFHRYNKTFFQKAIHWPRILYHLVNIRTFMRKCNSVVFISEWLRKTAGKHLVINTSEYHVIHSPVDCSIFKPISEEKFANRLQDKYHVPFMMFKSMKSNQYGYNFLSKTVSYLDKKFIFNSPIIHLYHSNKSLPNMNRR